MDSYGRILIDFHGHTWVSMESMVTYRHSIPNWIFVEPKRVHGYLQNSGTSTDVNGCPLIQLMSKDIHGYQCLTIDICGLSLTLGVGEGSRWEHFGVTSVSLQGYFGGNFGSVPDPICYLVAFLVSIQASSSNHHG